MNGESLLLAASCCADEPLCQFGGWQLAWRYGGAAWPHARAFALQAAAQPSHRPARLLTEAEPLEAAYSQAVVHLGRERQAALRDAIRCWNALAPRGRLFLHGHNQEGVATSIRRLTRILQQDAQVLVQRAHARVACIEKPDQAAVQELPAWLHWQLPCGSCLQAPPGVFAAGRVDPGSALLLSVLAEMPGPYQRILDLGTGCGLLGLHAARRWPDAACCLADADDRAVLAAQHNAQNWGLPQIHTSWWDSSEAPPLQEADLVLCNPPWHQQGQVERGPGLRMIEAAAQALSASGVALFVATTTQPFEGLLRQLGQMRLCAQSAAYKVLSLRR